MDPIAPIGSGTTPLLSDYQARATRPLDPALLAMLKPMQQQGGTARVVPSGRRGVRGTVVIDGNPTWSALNAALDSAGGGEEEPLTRPTPQREARALNGMGALLEARALNGTGTLRETPEGLDEMDARLKDAKRRFRVATLVKNIRLTKGKLSKLGKRIEIYRMDLRSLKASIMGARDSLRVAIFNRADAATVSNLSANLQRLEVAYGRLERMVGDLTAEYRQISIVLVELEAELSLLLG
jgi:hypothetical protein